MMEGRDTAVHDTAGLDATLDAATALRASAATTVLPSQLGSSGAARLVLERRQRYEPTRRLGEGGIGEVIAVRDHDIGRDVAMKRLRPAMKNAGAVARFAEEVRTIGRLEHPNIVPIHDVGVDEGGDYYFVMKYVDGETLETIIERLAAGDRATHERFTVERRVEIFAALLDAVAFAHDKGIVHRDIKPANVMIGAFGEVVLMDWGIAKDLRAEAAPEPSDPSGGPRSLGRRGPLFQTRVGEIVGTPAYMSPEQARGEPASERSDVYALCLLMHELLCLRHPLADKRTLAEVLDAVQREEVPMAVFVTSPHQPPPPADLSWFVRKGLAKDPNERYASVREMIARLDRRADGDIPVQCPLTFAKRTLSLLQRFVDRRPLLFSALFAAGVLSAGFGLVMVALRLLGSHR